MKNEVSLLMIAFEQKITILLIPNVSLGFSWFCLID
jgi:hypothetical protein